MWDKKFVFIARCGMKLQRRHWDKLQFEGAIRDRTVTCGTESHNLKIHEGTTLIFFLDKPSGQCLQEYSALLSHVSSPL